MTSGKPAPLKFLSRESQTCSDRRSILPSLVQRCLHLPIVFPDLYNAELQDSYGVSTPEDLVREMIDDPGEYNKFLAYVQEFNGFDSNMEDKVEEAKN